MIFRLPLRWFFFPRGLILKTCHQSPGIHSEPGIRWFTNFSCGENGVKIQSRALTFWLELTIRTGLFNTIYSDSIPFSVAEPIQWVKVQKSSTLTLFEMNGTEPLIISIVNTCVYPAISYQNSCCDMGQLSSHIYTFFMGVTEITLDL